MIVEAAWLARREAGGVRRLFQLVEAGIVTLAGLDSKAPEWISRFLERYPPMNPDVADAAPVYLAEREGYQTIFTVDRRDGLVYRLTDGRALRIVPRA